MRLSEWRAKAPVRDIMSPKVTETIEPVLVALGAERDPHAWVVWGDDAAVRYLIMALTPIGLAICHVRVNVPGEGPRVAGKLVRWSRVQVGELDVEMGGGHRLVSVQVESSVIRGVDDAVDQVAEFIHAVFAGMEGRSMQASDGPKVRASRATSRT